MNDVEDLCKKILKASKDKEGKYFYGVEYSSDLPKPEWKAYVGFSKEGVKPVIITAPTKASLKKQLNDYLANPSKDILVRYFEGQVEIHEQATRFFKQQIEEYENIRREQPTE